MAVLRVTLCIILLSSTFEMVLVSATALSTNQTVIAAVEDSNITDVMEAKFNLRFREVVEKLINTTDSNDIAMALNVTVELLESGCFDFTLLEMAGLQAEPPEQFFRTVTFDAVKKFCENNSTVAVKTKNHLRRLMQEIKRKEITETVADLVAQRRREDNETSSFTVLELLQTALNVSEDELVTSGILNVTSENLGFLNTSLEDLSCITGLPEKKLQSFRLPQLVSLTYSFRPLKDKIMERRSFLENKSLLQVANNASDALLNKTLLELATGDLPEYFAPFILKISCQHSYLFDYTVDRLEDLIGENLQNKTFFPLIQEVLSFKEFLIIEMEARKIQREEVMELSKIYGTTLEILAEKRRIPVTRILSMTLIEINSLLCYTSLIRYAEKNGKSLNDVAAMINVTDQQLQNFNVCRRVLPKIIVEKVTELLGYPPTTTNALLSCSLQPAPYVNFVDKCKLLKTRPLAFVLKNYDKLSLRLYQKTIFHVYELLVMDGTGACKKIFSVSQIYKLKQYPLSRIAKELQMERYSIFLKTLRWIVSKVIDDPDECQLGTNVCNRIYGTCINDLLSYKCRCPQAGRYKEPYCDDYDECQSIKHPHTCSDEQICVNIPGSFTCICRPGYIPANKTHCEDDDECESFLKNTCWTSSRDCINTIGSYYCSCKKGLTPVGRSSCQDIDECAQSPSVCGHIPNARCKNSYGGYNCECPRGYKSVLNSTSGQLQNCTDIDECSLESGLCKGEREVCSNSPGKYSCVCNVGYERYHGFCRVKRFQVIFRFYLRKRGSVAEIQIPAGFPYCGTVYYNLWIHYNGIISIGENYGKSNPESLESLQRNILAPFWANVNFGSSDSQVGFQVLERENEDHAETLDQISQLFIDKENLESSFKVSWALAVSWQSLSPYSRFICFLWFCRRTSNYDDEQNTFDAVIATNGTHSYVMYFYDKMGWNRDYLRRKAAVGFASDRSCRHQDPKSFGNEIFQINGSISFSLNSDITKPLTDEQRCVLWYNEEPEPTWESNVPQCPCDENSARISSNFWRNRDLGSVVFYQLVNPSDGHGRLCVYRRFFVGFFRRRLRSALLVGPNWGSRTQRYHWSLPEHLEYDQEPYNWCCASTTSNRQCHLYYEKRPSGRCTRARRRRRFRGWFFGDPHITTLDGFKYTFNGLGEYVLININENFAFHGRTARPKTTTGEPANATIFSGFAISAAGDTVQVHFSDIKPDNMSITVASTSNCSHYILSDLNDVKFFKNISLRKSLEKNNTLIVSTDSGITVEINPGLLGMLNLAVTLPQEMMNRTEGLMGKMNKDQSDDVAYRNGTIVHVTNATSIESQKEVFEMGQSWKVKDNERLFVNSTCAKEDVFFYANFTPAFFSMDSLGDLKENATRLCGNNLECLFDIAQTRNLDVGKETKVFEEENNKIKEVLDNEPPTIQGPLVLRAQVNQTVELQVSASDPDNDTLDYEVSGLPQTATFDNKTLILSWNVTSADNVSITVIVSDEKDATSQQPVIVHFCNCHNKGVCSSNETILGKGTVQFRFLKCSCSSWYEGDFCEIQRNPCANKPCFDDVTCALNQTVDKGYTCSACPSGLTGDGENCFAIDQCAINNGGCEQICRTSDGSTVTCACQPGYNLNDDGKNCTDIDECDKLTGSNDCADNSTCINGPGNYSCECKQGFEGNPKDSCKDINECDNGVAKCSQLCVNTPGTFQCSCKEGFQLANDSATCEDIDECKLAITNNCQMKCENLFSTYNCSCPAGFQLNSDHRTCSVEPSSKCDSTNGGCINGRCTNSSGNVTCHCSSGFNLNGVTCEDVDECQGSNHGCSQNCSNSRGGYQCSCKSGFIILDDKRSCQDIDECKSNPCSEDATCNNTMGSYQCKCKAGYMGDGKQCTNINECEESSPCSTEKRCKDLPGSYSCSCPPGKADLGSGCTRVKRFISRIRIVKIDTKPLPWDPAYKDTRSAEYRDLKVLLENEVNKFWRAKPKFNKIYKKCVILFIWEGSVNANVSLIFDSNATITTADLTNELKNASNVGILAVDPSASKASDVDECSQPDTNDCHAKATCINTPGSYECQCNDGYKGDGVQCELEETVEEKPKDKTNLILAIVIPIVCILLLIILICVCICYKKKKNNQKLTSYEEHVYITKHHLSERGAGRPINPNENRVGATDKDPRKESLSSGESFPEYDTPDATGSYDLAQGAYVNPASTAESTALYDNPDAVGSYDLTRGGYVHPASRADSIPLYDNPDATGSFNVTVTPAKDDRQDLETPM